MADETVYRVLTVYGADTSGARHELGSLAVVFDHILNLAERAKGMIEHMLDLSSSAESARIAMAGLINASNFSTNFNQGLGMASVLMTTMRADAAALSGTYEQMQTIFQTMIPVIHEAGKSLMAGEHMAGRVMEFGNTFGIPAEFIGREFRQMMEGRASIRNALFKDISSYMGNISGTDFNALDMAKKWEMVSKAMDKFNPMFAAVGDTFKAQKSTAESYYNQLVRIGSGSMFEGLKSALKDLNEWYRANQARVDAFVKDVGEGVADKLKSAFVIVKEAVTFMVDHREALVRIGEAFLIAKGFSMMGGGFRSGGGKAEAPGIGEVAGGAVFGLALSQLTGTTDATNRVMMATEGALAQMPGLLGMVAKGLLGFHAALQFAFDKIDTEHKKGVVAEGDLRAVRDYIKRGDSADLYSNLKQMPGMIVDGHLNPAAFAAWVNMKKIDNNDVGGENIGRLTGTAAAMIEMATKPKAFDPKSVAFGPAAPTEEQKLQQMLYAAGKPVENHVTNIGAINLYNNIYDAEDPARVLQKLTARALRASLEHPNQSAHAAVHR